MSSGKWRQSSLDLNELKSSDVMGCGISSVLVMIYIVSMQTRGFQDKAATWIS